MAQPLPDGPGGEKAPTIPQPPAGLYQYGFRIKIKGVLSQTQDFLTRIQEGERMFLVTSVQLEPDSDVGFGELTDVAEYTIDGYTYALIPPEQIPPSSAEGGENDQ
jgi:hypothetical protein